MQVFQVQEFAVNVKFLGVSLPLFYFILSYCAGAKSFLGLKCFVQPHFRKTTLQHTIDSTQETDV